MFPLKNLAGKELSFIVVQGQPIFCPFFSVGETSVGPVKADLLLVLLSGETSKVFAVSDKAPGDNCFFEHIFQEIHNVS